MSLLNALFQGILQGLTEFLPVSSSGHLSLFQYFTGQSGDSGAMFTILLHLGTLLAVFLAFYKTILSLIREFFDMVKDIFTGRFSLKTMNPPRRMILLLAISMIPMIFSLFLFDLFDQVSTDNDIVVEGGCFLITSLLLFMADNCRKGRKNASNMKYRDAVAIGTMQALAPFPGISRSGSTISVGLMAGLDRDFAVRFSFIMGIPPILAANIKELADIQDKGLGVSGGALVVGVLASLVFGLLAIKMVSWLVNGEKFRIFAWYTLFLGVLVLGIGIFERLTDHMIQGVILSLVDYIPKG